MRRLVWGLGPGIWVLGFGIWVLASGVIAAQVSRGGGRGRAPQRHAGREHAALVKQTLYDMADAIGMLRNPQEVDRIGSMNYWATGTILSGGQTCKVVDYKASVNWILKAMRIDYKVLTARRNATDRGGQGRPRVERNRAWQGRHARAAGTAEASGRCSSGRCPAGAVKVANDAGAATKITVENGKTVLTFPIASLNATMKLTLNKDSRIEQVESRMGTVTTVTTYEEYGDWNGADDLIDVMFPKHLVQKRGTATVMDLTRHQDQHLQPVCHHAGAPRSGSRQPVDKHSFGEARALVQLPVTSVNSSRGGTDAADRFSHPACGSSCLSPWSSFSRSVA